MNEYGQYCRMGNNIVVDVPELILGCETVVENNVKFYGSGPVYVGDYVVIKNGTIIKSVTGTYIHHNACIGAGVYLSAALIGIKAGAIIGDLCYITAGFEETPAQLDGFGIKKDLENIRIGKNCWIAPKFTALAPFNIPANSVVGPGTICPYGLVKDQASISNHFFEQYTVKQKMDWLFKYAKKFKKQYEGNLIVKATKYKEDIIGISIFSNLLNYTLYINEEFTDSAITDNCASYFDTTKMIYTRKYTKLERDWMKFLVHNRIAAFLPLEGGGNAA